MNGSEKRPTTNIACRTCEGDGQIANTDEGEPWSVWTSLPLESSLAVLAGIVRPIPCPDCGVADAFADSVDEYIEEIQGSENA